MDHLDDLAADDLRDALERVDGKTPTLRIVAAIAHRNGVTQTELAEWLGVERKTIYNWLRRFEEAPPAEAARDASRPGRPSKLTARQRRRVIRTLAAEPCAVGYDAPEWTVEAVAEYVRDRFGVTYSESSCRRLLREAELSKEF